MPNKLVINTASEQKINIVNINTHEFAKINIS